MHHLDLRQIKQLKRQLLDEETDLVKHQELNEHYGLSESHSHMSGEFSTYDNHPADAASELYEREKDVALNEHSQFQLEQVHRALEDIFIGHYGICVVCDAPISFERLEAIPTTQYCKMHSPLAHVSNRRPVEEKLLSSPFGRTSFDEQTDQNQFDGEDAWQIVESWGTSDSPAMSEDSEVQSYDSMYIESDETAGYVEDIESFLATDIYGNPSPIIRNRQYRKYMENNEGDRELEITK